MVKFWFETLQDAPLWISAFTDCRTGKSFLGRFKSHKSIFIQISSSILFGVAHNSKEHLDCPTWPDRNLGPVSSFQISQEIEQSNPKVQCTIRFIHVFISALEVWLWTFGSRPAWLVNKSARHPSFNQWMCSILKSYIILDYEDKYFQHVAEIYYIQADGTGRGIHINGSARCANYQGMRQLF